MTDTSSGLVRLSPSAQGIVEDHAFSRIDVEVGGFLLGRIRGDDTEIVSAKPALTAESNQTHLTITHEAWAEILEVMDSDYPGLSIVGWYHTHPDFGIFYSTPDLFVHRNFFGAKGQVGIVIDPIRKERGVFANTAQGLHLMQRYEVSRNGKQGHFVHCSYAAEPLRDALPAATAAAHSQSESSAFTASSLDSIEANLARMERQNHNMLRLLLCWIPLAILIAFGAGLFVGSRMFASQVTVSVSQKDVEAIMGGNGAGTDGKSKESSGKVVK